MAARKQRWHPDEVRQRIQASQLINRLTKHALSKSPIMDASQVNAAKALLAKVLPDLASVEHSGALEHTYVARIPEPAETAEEWQKQHAPTVQ